MKHSFHCHLSKSFLWYKNWHTHPRHQHVHWSAFIILAIAIFSFVTSSISYLDQENGGYAQAQSSPSGTIWGYYSAGTGVVLDYTSSDLCVDSNGNSGLIIQRNTANIFLLTSNLPAGTEIDTGYGGPGTYDYDLRDAGCGVSSQQVLLDSIQVTVAAGTGTIWTNTNSCPAPCNIVVDYNTQNVSNCSIRKNGSSWRPNLQPNCPAGTQTDNNLSAGTYTYSLRDDDTGSTLDSTTVTVGSSGGSGGSPSFNLGSVTWGSDLDISNWTQSISLFSVTISGSTICLDHDGYSLLSRTNNIGRTDLIGNYWVFVNIGGQWHASTWDWISDDPNSQKCKNISNIVGRNAGGALNNSNLASWSPSAGEILGFAVSGIARSGASNFNEQIRSNIVMQSWTGNTGGGGGGGGTNLYDLTVPNNNFYQLLSQYTNAANARGIYTLLAVYNMWLDDPGQGWSLNPFNPINNVNPETSSLTDPDIFIQELASALSGNTSTTTRQFLRNVWQTLIIKLAQNTPNTILFQPLSEPSKDDFIFGSTTWYYPIITQVNTWWNKGKLVDNPSGRNDPIHPQAIYRDYHYNFSTESGANLIGSDTIVNTDTRCDPPPDSEITSSAIAARNNGGNYLVYDCLSASNWTSRVIPAINAGLNGIQPGVNMGQGTLIGYGGPDFWINITNNGSYISFLDQLRNAGGNLTFALATTNLSVAQLPWALSTGGGGSSSGGGNYTTGGNPNCALTLGDPSYCKVCNYLCGPGEGDCSGNSTCQPGLICNDTYGIGLKYGYTDPNTDVCEDPALTASNIRIYYVFPYQVQNGGTILIAGENLADTVDIIDANGNTNSYTGNVNKNATEVTLPLPSLIPGFYSIQIRSGSNTSNKVSFEVIPGNFVQSITATSPPIISAIYPPTVTQGGIFQITGSSLTSNVQFFDPNGVLQGSTFGVVSTNLTEVTAIAPYSIPPGIYTIGITGPFGLAKSLNVITITAGQVPIPPSAQSVPTATSTTTFQSLISGAFDYAVIVVSIAVFVMLLYAGFLWLTSPANPSNIARAKSMIYNAIIGAVLLLSAYVILNTINPELVGGNLNLPGISAPAPLPPVPQPPPPGGLCPNNQFGRPDNGCSGCVVMTVGIPRKSGVGDIHAPNPKVAPSVDTSLVQLQGAAAGLNLNWQVTEAYCPTVSHQDQDHYNGRAVDIAITGTATVQNVKNLCTIAKNAGFTVVNEYVSMGSQTTPECPAPLSSSTTTGDHLHIEN